MVDLPRHQGPGLVRGQGMVVTVPSAIVTSDDEGKHGLEAVPSALLLLLPEPPEEPEEPEAEKEAPAKPVHGVVKPMPAVAAVMSASEQVAAQPPAAANARMSLHVLGWVLHVAMQRGAPLLRARRRAAHEGVATMAPTTALLGSFIPVAFAPPLAMVSQKHARYSAPETEP